MTGADFDDPEWIDPVFSQVGLWGVSERKLAVAPE